MVAKTHPELTLPLSRREALAATSLLASPISNLALPPGRPAPDVLRTSDLLYQTGIVAQLALTSHLLDVGFDDRWCARHIGLHIGKALAYANGTGLNYHSPALERLAPALSPYNVWRNPDLHGSRPPVPKSLPDIPALLRGLLDHVRGVTGHPRPRRGQAHD